MILYIYASELLNEYQPSSVVTKNDDVQHKRPCDSETLKARYRKMYPTGYVPLTMVDKDTSASLNGLEEIYHNKNGPFPRLVLLNGSSGEI